MGTNSFISNNNTNIGLLRFLDFEIKRQNDVVRLGQCVVNETRSFDMQKKYVSFSFTNEKASWLHLLMNFALLLLLWSFYNVLFWYWYNCFQIIETFSLINIIQHQGSWWRTYLYFLQLSPGSVWWSRLWTSRLTSMTASAVFNE